MAVVKENWQTKRSTILERTTFIFNNELLSDVKFVVPVSTGVSENKKVIPAHKFVLAISSLACRTGMIFCVFQANRGESEASAWRARVACERRSAKKSRLSPYHCSSRSGVQI